MKDKHGNHQASPPEDGSASNAKTLLLDGLDESADTHQSTEVPAVLNNRFELIEPLGQGGMGKVFKARDRRKVEARDSNEFIAIKLLSDSFRQHPDALASLQQEATKTQALYSENIVRVFDFDRDGDTIYMTMELLVGKTLAQLLDEARSKGEPLSNERIWAITEDICNALTAAHRSGIVHSDLKPDNVFVCDSGQVKLLDFGIARASPDGRQDRANNASHSLNSRSGVNALTPAYASAEMLSGEAPDARDDIYALGCIVYEMLCAEHPFRRASALQAQQLAVKPARVEHLSNEQWRTLSSAIVFERQQRLGSIDEFRRGLIPSAPVSNIRRFGLPLALAAALMLFFGNFYRVWDNERQKAADLATQSEKERSAFFAKNLEKVDQCLAQENPYCARGHLELARSVNPKDARTLVYDSKIAQVEDRLAKKREMALEAQRDLAEERAKAAELRLREEMENAAKLKLQSQVSSHLEKASTCIDSEALPCAQKHIDVVATLSPQNSLLKTMMERLNQLKRKVAVASKQLEQESETGQPTTRDTKLPYLSASEQKKFDAWIRTAENCLSFRQINCAQQNLAMAAELAPTAPSVLSLQKRIDSGDTSGSEQYAYSTASNGDIRARIRSLLRQADSCLQTYQYSCAARKARQVLAIDPNNSAALAIERRLRGRTYSSGLPPDRPPMAAPPPRSRASTASPDGRGGGAPPPPRGGGGPSGGAGRDGGPR